APPPLISRLVSVLTRHRFNKQAALTECCLCPAGARPVLCGRLAGFWFLSLCPPIFYDVLIGRESTEMFTKTQNPERRTACQPVREPVKTRTILSREKRAWKCPRGKKTSSEI